jgi:hypothetical protein
MSWAPSVLAVFASALGQTDPWAEAWADLGALRSGTLSPAEASTARVRLEHRRSRLADGPRAELLAASLEALDGRDVGAVATRLYPSSALFGTEELWHLADLLPRGMERTRTVIAALAPGSPVARWQAVLAWNVSVDAARALDLEAGALPIQLALHERFQDPATAIDLSITHRALGHGDAADLVLAAALRRAQQSETPAGDLWEARGINSSAFGDEQAARDSLGKALAEGSMGAALLVARLDLMSGRTDPARLGFGALVHEDPPPDWAWRGWGMTLLPTAFEPPFRPPTAP